MTRIGRVLSLDWDWFVGKGDGQSCLCCLDCPEGRKSEKTSKIQSRKRAVRRTNGVWRVRGTRCSLIADWQKRESYTRRVVELVKRFHVKQFVVANSHGHIMRFLPPCAEVHNLDLHKDAWDKSVGECGHWANDKRICHHYWYQKESAFPLLVERLRSRRVLDLVFLALSTPHTARADDKQFFRFVRALSKAAPPEFVGVMQKHLEREYRKCV